MKQAVVIYESKYGSTKRYAEWIADALSCPLLEEKKVRPKDLEPYDTIIFGGGLYAGRVNGIKLITGNFARLGSKKLILFTCGLADPSVSQNVEQIRRGLTRALAPELLERLSIFHFRGGIDYAKLSFLHRLMMRMLYKNISKKAPGSLREDEKMILDTYGKSVDFTDPQGIQPLLDDVLSN